MDRSRKLVFWNKAYSKKKNKVLVTLNKTLLKLVGPKFYTIKWKQLIEMTQTKKQVIKMIHHE